MNFCYERGYFFKLAGDGDLIVHFLIPSVVVLRQYIQCIQKNKYFLYMRALRALIFIISVLALHWETASALTGALAQHLLSRGLQPIGQPSSYIYI